MKLSFLSFLALVVLTLTLSLSGCSYSEAELSEAYNKGYEEGYKKGVEDALASEGKNNSQQKDISYSKHYLIQTYYVAAASIILAKGEVFEVSMTLQKADKAEAITPPVDGALIFWIRDSNRRRVLDAGRIEGFYEFIYPVEASGTYTLVFQDEADDHCIIYMDYNSSSELTDATFNQ